MTIVVKHKYFNAFNYRIKTWGKHTRKWNVPLSCNYHLWPQWLLFSKSCIVSLQGLNASKLFVHQLYSHCEKCEIQIKSSCTNGAPGHILHSTTTTAGFTRSGWPWIDFDWPWDQDQPKVSVSLTLDFDERMLDKKVWTVSCHSVIRILTFACDA